MLLDRVADVHLAKRCGADGWLVKPLDPLRLRRAARAVAAGSRYTEGLHATCRTRLRPDAPRETPASWAVPQVAPGRAGAQVAWQAATGCSAAWLARHVRDVEAGGSNPLTPTPSGSAAVCRLEQVSSRSEKQS